MDYALVKFLIGSQFSGLISPMSSVFVARLVTRAMDVPYLYPYKPSLRLNSCTLNTTTRSITKTVKLRTSLPRGLSRLCRGSFEEGTRRGIHSHAAPYDDSWDKADPPDNTNIVHFNNFPFEQKCSHQVPWLYREHKRSWCTVWAFLMTSLVLKQVIIGALQHNYP